MIETAEISRHAWQQFIRRWPAADLPLCPMQELRALLKRATEETDIGFGAALRTINNGFTPARYFVFERWRFVLTEDMSKIVTIERIFIKTRKPKKRSRR